MKSARLLPPATAALILCLLSAGPALPGDKKTEALREKGEFTAATPKDKVRKDCPCKLYALPLCPTTPTRWATWPAPVVQLTH